MGSWRFSSQAYTVGPVPGAGLAFLGPVGGHAVVRGALYRVIVLWQGWARGHTVALAEGTEQPQCRWLLTGSHVTDCFS